MKKFVLIIFVVVGFTGLLQAQSGLYFADLNGNPISQIIASPSEQIAVYVFGQTGISNSYDLFNLSIVFDHACLSPTSGDPTQDLLMNTDANFGAAFGHQEVVYSGVTILNAASGGMGESPEGFGPTLLATVYFTVLGVPTEVSFFNEDAEYTYSTFFMDTWNLEEVRFLDSLTIIPEPVTSSLFTGGLLVLLRRKRTGF